MSCLQTFATSPGLIQASGLSWTDQETWVESGKLQALTCIMRGGMYLMMLTGLMEMLDDSTPSLQDGLRKFKARLSELGWARRKDFYKIGVCAPRSCEEKDAAELCWHYILRWAIRVPMAVASLPSPKGAVVEAVFDSEESVQQFTHARRLAPDDLFENEELKHVELKHVLDQVAHIRLNKFYGGRRHHEALGEPRLQLPREGRKLRQWMPRGSLRREGVRVGLFVQKWYPRRKFELAFGVALRAALQSPSAASLPYFEIHVVAFYWLPMQEMAAAVREAIPSSVHAEVHVISRFNPFSGPSIDHQNSYMAGMHKAASICYARNLTHMLNTDDDIMFEPSAFTGLLASAHLLHPRSDCAVLAPTNPTSVPTAEIFAEHFLPREHRVELERCYAESSLPTGHGMSGANWSYLNPMPDPWNADAFFEKVAKLPFEDYCRGDGEDMPNSICNNLCAHPVRLDTRCMTIATRLAINALVNGRIGKPPAALDPHRIELAEPSFPYFTNSVWLMRLDEYERILGSRELYHDGIDETPMSRWTHRAERKVCFLTKTFVLHPSYSTNPEMAALEWQAFAGMMAHLQRAYPKAYESLPAHAVYDNAQDLSDWATEAVTSRDGGNGLNYRWPASASAQERALLTLTGVALERRRALRVARRAT